MSKCMISFLAKIFASGRTAYRFLAMLLIITATYPEARPLIRYFGLKKIGTINGLKVYESDSFLLLIGGVGRKAVSVSVIQFLQMVYDRQIFVSGLINIGASGCFDRTIDKGTVFIIRELVDSLSWESYSWNDNLVAKNILLHASLLSVVHPLSRRALAASEFLQAKTFLESNQPGLVDMEASTFVRLATRFFPLSAVRIIKIVSDHLEPESTLPALSDVNYGPVFKFLETLVNSSLINGTITIEQSPINPELVNMGSIIADTWKLSSQQITLLQKQILAWIAQSESNSLSILLEMSQLQPTNKTIRNTWFKQYIDSNF